MSFVVGLLAVAVFVLMAPALQHLARARSWSLGPVTLLAIAAVVSHGLGVTLGIRVVPQFQYWDAASIFGFCVMAYVFAFGSVYKSVSLDILLGLVDRPERRAPLPDIVERQVPDLFQGRIRGLIDGGLVRPAGSHFEATAAGRTMAGRVGWLRRVFGIGDTSLYDFPD
ncbi:hypothetical protein [Bradyrhizobium sp. UNPA324]|uniref:hypothetical protein n=1 Tax=Bradyrhizobium sp. UNPA324 TaxID=1141174 RepID=UPI00114E6321|nr:hypothetical protein [Bradyrhizobium sp. UNPA324]TQF29567.1 hypothetical protein UNPA324_07860 [Bradyrhizobium sp. UNPA324]